SKYGKTWWGGKFLDAFNGIDETNRLPRGVTYANNGSCAGIKLEKNEVRASVQGSDPTPYQVRIQFADFSQEKQKIQSVIQQKGPVVLSKLLNRELPESILDDLERARLPIFPSSWRHVTARCSCPDRAVPCKHIAAVIFLTAGEIDKNPFLVFKIHGLDIQNEVLAKLGGGGNVPGGAAASSSAATGGASTDAAEGKKSRKKGATGKHGGDKNSSKSSVISSAQEQQTNTALSAGGLSIGEIPVFSELVCAPVNDVELVEPDETAQMSTSSNSTTPIVPKNLVDFTKLTNLSTQIQDILKKEPPFFPNADFTQLLGAAYKHWAKIYGGSSANAPARRVPEPHGTAMTRQPSGTA
ncbi:unnamed protein product, partial [Amoebophrya sp. A120]